MYSNDDISSLHDFLSHTPEGGLRKMLVGGDFSDAHLRLLLKMAKGGDQNSFIECFQNEDMGKMKLNPKESAMKDSFWPLCKNRLSSLGLIGKSGKSAA